MKATMGEIDGKMAIYRRNLGQNSRWNTNLPLKFKSGRWITNWDKSGRWITLLPLESPLGHWINAGGNLSRQIALERGAKNRQKIGDLSPKYRRFPAATGDLMKKSPIYRDSAIYRRFIAD